MNPRWKCTGPQRIWIGWVVAAPVLVIALVLSTHGATSLLPGVSPRAASTLGVAAEAGSSPARSLVGGSAAVYNVTFDESGLPLGTPWQVGVAPEGTGFFTYVQSSGSAISQAWPNGSYAVAVAANLTGYFPLHLNSSLVVAGGSVVVPVQFAFRYTLTFEATGLPSGASWTASVIQGSNRTSGSSLTNEIELLVAPGAYNYSVYSSGLVATPSAGQGTAASNANVSVALALPSIYPGYLTGIVNVGSAYFYLNGYLFYVQLGGGFFFQLKPGAYTVIVTADGYNPYYNTTDIVSNQTVIMDIGLVPTPSPPPPLPAKAPLLSNFAWLVIGILVIALAIASVVAWIQARGRRPPPPGPIKEAPPIDANPDTPPSQT